MATFEEALILPADDGGADREVKGHEVHGKKRGTAAAEENDDSSESQEKTSEEILREVLSRSITDVHHIEEIVNHVPSSPTELDAGSIFKALQKDMNYVWFDLFKAVGMRYEVLEEIRQRHPRDPDSSLFEAITAWLSGEEPKPSWRALVNALYYTMIEAKLATTIARTHLSSEEFATYVQDTSPKPYSIEPQSTSVSASTEAEDNIKFSKLVLEIADQLGPYSFPELSICLRALLCPNGMRFLPEGVLQDEQSVDGMLASLLHHNVLNPKDLDLLITVLRILGREDLFPLLYDYSSQITIGLPRLQEVQNTDNFFSLCIELMPHISLDLEGVCLIKQDLCELMGVAKVPYLVQFLGWVRRVGVVVQFQVHMSLVDRVQVVVNDPTKKLENYLEFEMDVKKCLFRYDLNKLKGRR